jgi:hypothetical protein
LQWIKGDAELRPWGRDQSQEHRNDTENQLLSVRGAMVGSVSHAFPPRHISDDSIRDESRLDSARTIARQERQMTCPLKLDARFSGSRNICSLISSRNEMQANDPMDIVDLIE